MTSRDVIGMIEGGGVGLRGGGGSWKVGQFGTFGKKTFFPQFTNISATNKLHTQSIVQSYLILSGFDIPENPYNWYIIKLDKLKF